MTESLVNPWTSWHADPSIIIGVALLAGWYLNRWQVLRRLAPSEAPGRGQIVRFCLAMAAILLALISPLHDLSDHYLFTAHMVQHLLLILVMPPLLLSSLTPAMLRPLWRVPGVLPVGRRITQPVVAFLLCNLIFAASHIPWMYTLVLEVHGLHVFEHIIFMVTATILWWPILSPSPELPRLPYPLQMVYLFLQTIPGGMVGGTIVNAREPLYQFYVDAPRVIGLTPLEDQQLGSLIMWVGGGTFFLLSCTVIFFVWAGKEMSATGPRPISTTRAAVPHPTRNQSL
jgi:putative membrane protein